jgi:hypothetical protein
MTPGKPDLPTFVQDRVRDAYWHKEQNCAVATLGILSEWFGIQLHSQVMDSAVGMHGAGGCRAQCGLVEGALMFLGILGKAHGLADDQVVQNCREYAGEFEVRFGSLSCRLLRPEGFHPDQPPHLCEGLTCDAIAFDIEFVSGLPQEPTGEISPSGSPMSSHR